MTAKEIWNEYSRSIPEDTENDIEYYARIVAGKEIMFKEDFLSAIAAEPLPEPREIDWDAMLPKYREWLKNCRIDGNDGIQCFTWLQMEIKSRPEFQLRQSWEERAVGFAEWCGINGYYYRVNLGLWEHCEPFKLPEKEKVTASDLLQLYIQSPEYKSLSEFTK